MKATHYMHVCMSYFAYVYEVDENISCHITGKAKQRSLSKACERKTGSYAKRCEEA